MDLTDTLIMPRKNVLSSLKGRVITVPRFPMKRTSSRITGEHSETLEPFMSSQQTDMKEWQISLFKMEKIYWAEERSWIL